jgi:hypothetical protein
MSQKLNSAIAVIGIDIGNNSFHLVGHDKRGEIVLRQKCLKTGAVCGWAPIKIGPVREALLFPEFGTPR